VLPLKFFSLIHVNATLESAGKGRAERLLLVREADTRAHRSHEAGPLSNGCRF
jgi:hypothetical protein